MNENIEIHETAFVTATFRSYNEALSKDTYAKLWQHKNTDAWIEEYLEKVSAEEAATHCLRNRFFFETIKKLVATSAIEVLINFGSGFSMYPFLLDEKLIHIEIDKPEIVEYKKSKITEWQNNQIVPKRNVSFIGVDFSKNYEEELKAKIHEIKGGKSCFILIEGVLFFLNKGETDALFSFFDTVQESGDFVGSASFQHSLKDTVAFKNLLRFFNEKLEATTDGDFQTIADGYYKAQERYQLIDHQDYFSLSNTYGHTIQLERELILNENFYVLQKF